MKDNKLIGGTLIIAGTTIGAAMLALPISTGLAGFFPALAIFALCWLMMLWSAFLYLEVNLSLPGDVNLISMARTTLGPIGAAVAWAGLLLLLYSLLAAYMTGSGPLFLDGVEKIVGFDLPSWLTPFPILVLFGPLVYFGMRPIDYVNRYLMVGLVAAFAVMIGLLLPRIDTDLLLQVDLDFALVSLSVVFVSFGYHIVIPSLTTYFQRDVQQIKRCIVYGSLLPIVVYLIWEMAILGSLPVSGRFGIAQMIQENIAVSQSLEYFLGNPIIVLATRLFALLAIVTSFLGVALSCFDFLKDGIKAKNTPGGRMQVWVLSFLPPLVFVAVSQKGFVTVLEYAGLFIAVLLGIMPILMTWSARYIKKLESPYRVMGGKVAFALGILFYSAIVLLVIGTKIGLITYSVEKYL